MARNGTDYGVPLAGSTVVITLPDKTKRPYMLNVDGEWTAYAILETFPSNVEELDEDTIYFIMNPYDMNSSAVYQKGGGAWRED